MNSVSPSCSRTVAYRELARGHDCREQKPVKLYSFLQKFWVVVLTISWLSSAGVTSSLLDLVRAEPDDQLQDSCEVEGGHLLSIDDGPDDLVGLR
jgi:hypothetical protein